jgi:hypothetical protein
MKSMSEECEYIMAEAKKQNVLLRVIGGMAVHIHCPQASMLPELKREYGDLDFVTASPDDQHMRKFFDSINFSPNSRFNALQGKTRMIFNNPDNTWHIDIFINEFRMCHNLVFNHARLQKDNETIPLAELLLTKLQIVEINAKDVKDIAAILLEHPLGNHDNETINVNRIIEITSNDWGFFTTVRLNIEKIPTLLDAFNLSEDKNKIIKNKLEGLAKSVDEAPKSMNWKLRAMLGKSKKWYEEPEDAARDELKLE